MGRNKMKIAITGHRPNKIGGYATCQKHVALKDHMRTFLKEKLSQNSDLTLISGGALGIDQFWIEVGQELNIPIMVIIPFHGFEAKWPIHSQQYFHKLIDKCHGISYASNEIPRNKQEAVAAILKRDRMLIQAADAIVAYWNGSSGGTAHTVKFAKESNKEPIIFNPDEIS
jgi:uncharacterized phage-like protein YoqJ